MRKLSLSLLNSFICLLLFSLIFGGVLAENDEFIPVQSLKLESGNITLLLGGPEAIAQGHIDITATPDNATVHDYLFSSDNEAVVTVDNNGNIKAVGIGRATITVVPNEEKPRTKVNCYITVGNAVTDIELQPSQTVNVGQSVSLRANIAPENALNKNVEYTSSDEEIVSVTKQGYLKAIKCGTATITCLATDGSGVSATCTVTVIKPVQSIKLDSNNINLLIAYQEESQDEKQEEKQEGSQEEEKKTGFFTAHTEPVSYTFPEAISQAKLNPVIVPEDATVQTCSFTSSDESVVTVDDEGNLQAVGLGRATITIVPNEENSRAKATCNVIVGYAVNKIEIPDTLTVNINETAAIKPSVLPTNAFSKEIVYSSSDETVATVSNNGIVKGIKCGKATIVCSAADGSGVQSISKIKVVQPVTRVWSDTNRIVMIEGDAVKWNVNVEPFNATNKELSYYHPESGNGIAYYDGEYIIGNMPGKTTMIAESTDGSKKSCKCELIVEPYPLITIDSIAFGKYNNSLMAMNVRNECKYLTVVDFDFDMTFYDYSGNIINEGSFNLGKRTRINPGKLQQIKRSIFGASQAYKTVITVKGVLFSGDVYLEFTKSQQPTWTYIAN